MKKKLFSMLLATSTLVSGVVFAQEKKSSSDLTDFYVRGFGNAGFRDKIKTTAKSLPGANTNSSAKVGFGGGASIGYYVFEQFRVEVEGSYHQNDTKNQTITLGGVTTVKNKAEHFALMANGFYDIPLTDAFSLYLGGGLGAAFETFKSKYSGGTNFNYSSSKTAFAWQLMAGVAYDFNEHVGVSAGYRLFSVPSHNGKNTTINGTNTGIKIADAFIHNIEVGIKYRF